MAKRSRRGVVECSVTVTGRPIELGRVDLNKEARESVELGVQDGRIPIYGTRAISLLIGNTFVSKEAAENLKREGGEICPARGDYYSPGGTIVHFECNGPPDYIWSMEATHWKIISGLLCRDDVGALGEFGCERASVTAIPTPQNPGEKMLVMDSLDPFQDARTGYVGNIFNFRIDNQGK